MTEPDLVSSLMEAEAQSIALNAQRLGLTWDLRPATVREGGARTLLIVYDGDVTPVQAISLVGPIAAGVRVYGAWIPPGGNFVLGFNSAPGFVDGVNVTTGNLAVGVSAETNLSQLALSGNVKNGYSYLIGVQFRVTVTSTTDDWQVGVRRDTALTGTVLANAQWSGDNTVGTHYWSWVFTATADETLNLFFSVVRIAGAGTITVIGSPGGGVNRSMSFLALSAPSFLWRSA